MPAHIGKRSKGRRERRTAKTVLSEVTLDPPESSSSDTEQRIITPLFANLILLNLFSSSMAQMNTAGSPVLVAEAHAPSAYGGALIAVFVTACMISRIARGRRIDESTRRAVLVRGILAYLAGCAVAILVPTLQALIPARILQGWGFSAVHTAASTCAADVLPEKRLGEGLGYYGLGHAAAMALGPMLGVALADTGFTPALALGSACLAVIALAISLTIRYEDRPETLPSTSGYRIMRAGCTGRDPSSMRTFTDQAPIEPNELPAHELMSTRPNGQPTCKQASDKPIERTGISPSAKGLGAFLAKTFEITALRSGVPMLLVGCTIGFFISFTAIFAKGSGFGSPNIFFVLAAITSFVVRATSSKSLDACSPRMLFAVPVGIGALTLALMYCSSTGTMFSVCGIGYGICLGISIPLLGAMAVKFAPPERWGAANALFLCLYDIGIGYGALLWGLLNDAFGFPSVFVAATLCLFAAFIVALFTLSEKS